MNCLTVLQHIQNNLQFNFVLRMFLWEAVILTINLCKAVCMAPDSTANNDLYHCEDGWKKYDQHCYKLIETHLNWRDASTICQSMGGYLANIHSKEQNDFFEDFSLDTDTGYWWIGLHDHECDGIFSWADGTEVVFTNWVPGEPEGGYLGSGDCVIMNFYLFDGKWYALRCSNERAFMCQKKVPRNKTTNKDKNHIHGCISVTNFIVTLIIVIMFMALMGGTFYYKRHWLEEKHSKVATVSFRRTEYVPEPSTKCIIEPK